MGLRVIEGGAGAPAFPPGRRQQAPALRVIEGRAPSEAPPKQQAADEAPLRVTPTDAFERALPDGATLQDVIAGPVPGRVPSLADLQAEAARRLAPLDMARWEVRLKATGLPVPRDIARKRREIEFVAEMLGRLDAIPTDYRADLYWPAPLP